MSWQPTNSAYGNGSPRLVPVTVDLRVGTRKTIAIVAGVCGGIGLLGLIDTLPAVFAGGGSVELAVLSGVLLLAGLLPLVFYRRLTRTRKLVLEPGGLRWYEPSGTSWALSWQELRAVQLTIQKTIYRDMDSRSTRTHYWLDLIPRGQDTLTRHPEMAPLWEAHTGRGAYRLWDGIVEKTLVSIDHGLRTFAPRLYTGLTRTGDGW